MKVDKPNNDLSAYINQNCSPLQTVLDIDIVQFKEFPDQVKPKIRVIRFIEYKHTSEPIRNSQVKFFPILKNLFTWLNQAYNDHLSFIDLHYKFELFLIMADPPFNEAQVYNYLNDEEKQMIQPDFNRFLNLEIDYFGNKYYLT